MEGTNTFYIIAIYKFYFIESPLKLILKKKQTIKILLRTM
jgi:hypothetical protein